MRITYPETFKYVARANLRDPDKKTYFPCLKLAWENRRISVLGSVSRAVEDISQSDCYLAVSFSLLGNQIRPLLERAPIMGLIGGSLIVGLNFANFFLSDYSFARKLFFIHASFSAGVFFILGGFLVLPKEEKESRALSMFCGRGTNIEQ
ncbi:hypothetical protein A2276_01850 [candidate division WOR-1 bacterium RIFOXYA12_FULL_43_27]|uniref:Uncharacterized protein n=1 Tax=candidate division WOR-1 bacterium RIFOXYC2_FULL_46_14 TaxID=1802587 RepID=A0A1F4U6U0_UNCSA|nr:MAG: hypothetical protein A2276_01850 [candidate division WOR-1 bacterium RIFOXYA12_FULL_43_27]OGC19533.1 MAG: hypothetical protein A2292_02480 [candidate division WOR-1 bacterium RIFOXYB2_FULL_46_45]OGC30521.1 MAG: hypothetical protein A2232_02480 [candidate division WOR-1 bacterium RIFOXYA2_FULL_46_56]OGC40589.1 MAG: hypothetical protein A2438_06195 [candidate division WOR-1 bacterium RIFOXYC2_FULL_46_14]